MNTVSGRSESTSPAAQDAAGGDRGGRHQRRHRGAGAPAADGAARRQPERPVDAAGDAGAGGRQRSRQRDGRAGAGGGVCTQARLALAAQGHFQGGPGLGAGLGGCRSCRPINAAVQTAHAADSADVRQRSQGVLHPCHLDAARNRSNSTSCGFANRKIHCTRLVPVHRSVCGWAQRRPSITPCR